jgi:hypothetical protein
MFGDDFLERLHYGINPHWSGDILRTLLIAPSGATVRRLKQPFRTGG